MRVVHHHDDVLAAHLEVDLLEVRRRVLVDELPVRGRAGERHHRDVRMRRPAASPPPGPPVTRLTTPAGTPASTSALHEVDRGERRSSAGLNTTVLPQISAGMIFHDGIAIGKFHGVIIPHTPIGWRTDIANLLRSSDGVVWPNSRRPSPAMK